MCRDDPDSSAISSLSYLSVELEYIHKCDSA